jgi:hypothetical protein
LALSLKSVAELPPRTQKDSGIVPNNKETLDAHSVDLDGDRVCASVQAHNDCHFAVKKELLLKNLCVEADGNHEHKYCEHLSHLTVLTMSLVLSLEHTHF